MKSIEKRFNRIAERNPLWSTYMCFASAIDNQGFKRKAIYEWFNNLVDKDDYCKTEKYEVLAFLVRLSNPLRKVHYDAFLPHLEVKNNTTYIIAV